MKRNGIIGFTVFMGIVSGALAQESRPHPVTNPSSPVMLIGNWFGHPHEINERALPEVPREHIVINDVTAANGVNQHNYLIHYGGRFWAMWSDGPQIEDRVGQVVKYATSEDGRTWSDAKYLTDYPPDSGPDSPHYNTRTDKGYRYIARGFWVREPGELLALVSLDEAGGFFGRSLKLLAYRWNPATECWEEKGLVHDNAINNFSPKRLPTGEWMMSRRPWNYRQRGVEFLIGGVEGIDAWSSFPVPEGPLQAEEPYWWELPDGNLMALFRNNRGSGYIYRSFSTDNGRTWSQPVQTDFPDAASKFHGTRLADGRYVLVSNSHPRSRRYFTLAISDDGMVFDRLFFLLHGVGGGSGGSGVDYPMVMEHDGYLYIAHSGGFGGRKQSVELQRVKIADLDELSMENVTMRAQAPRAQTVTPTRKAEMEVDGMSIQVEVHGTWGQSGRSDERFADAYYFMPPNGHGIVRFIPELPKAGRYRVEAWWNTQGTRFSSVPYVIMHAEGEARVTVDQRKDGGKWMELGTFSFAPAHAAVEIRAEGFNDYLVADAVRFVSVE